MQSATLPPWLSPWPSGVLYGRRKMKALDYYRAIAHERARQRSRSQSRSRLTIYTYGDTSRSHRIGGWSGRGNTVRPLPGPGAGWERTPLDQFFLERYPLEFSAPVAPLPPDLSPGRMNVEWVAPSAGPAPGPGPGAGAVPGAGALRAWAAASALLALLVLLARAADACLHTHLLKKRRRSQEWPTPNVRATSNQLTDDGALIIPGLENAEPLPADLSDTVSIDLPPPYSECTEPGAPDVSTPGTSFAHNKMSSDLLHEEPPPPYSDCYVEFSNKNGIPSVLIFSRKRTPIINRQEITGIEESQVIDIDDDVTTVEQNMENVNSENTSEVAKGEGVNERDTNHINVESSNDETLNTNFQGTETNRYANTSKSVVDEDSLKSRVVFV